VLTLSVSIAVSMEGPSPTSWYFLCALVLGGTELNFFIVANMGLCLEFALKTVLIRQGCFNYCWAMLTQGQGLVCSSHHPTSQWAGGAQEAGRGLSQHSWPQL